MFRPFRYYDLAVSPSPSSLWPSTISLRWADVKDKRQACMDTGYTETLSSTPRPSYWPVDSLVDRLRCSFLAEGERDRDMFWGSWQLKRTDFVGLSVWGIVCARCTVLCGVSSYRSDCGNKDREWIFIVVPCILVTSKFLKLYHPLCVR